jgi:hypothetical protein
LPVDGDARHRQRQPADEPAASRQIPGRPTGHVDRTEPDIGGIVGGGGSNPVALHNLPQHETARISRVQVREAAAPPAGWCPDRRRCRLAEWATDGGVCLAARCSIVGPDAALGLPLDATAAPSTGSRA